MIQLKNIHLQINNQVLLENEKFEAYEGYVYVIMGESGTGKTTLLYELSLLSHISHGEYYWNHQRIDQYNDQQKSEIRKNHIGYILQNLELISDDLSLEDNMKCMFALSGQDYNEDKVKEYMEKVNLHISLDQKIQEMSRGERQRFALVLALVKDVELIICDEPTSALDVENAQELMSLLKTIANEYKKIIIIASHDEYVKDQADVLYQIKDNHLIKDEITNLKNHEIILKENRSTKQKFYQIYKNAHQGFIQWVMKIIYIIMIMILCIAPTALNSLLERQEDLYHTYASTEIIVMNTSQSQPFGTYNGVCTLFTSDQFNMLTQINHVENVRYYWEINGFLNNDFQVTLVPKSDIDTIVISSQLAQQIGNDIPMIDGFLTYDNKEYEIKIDLSNYTIKDYLSSDHFDHEVIYMPYEMMSELLEKQGIISSSSISIECDEIKNVEITMTQIQRWLSNATLSSHGLKYLNQIELLQTIQNLIFVLRMVMIMGIIVISFMIQMMTNKARKEEICNLRINGMNKSMFYTLYYYENRVFIFILMFCCTVGYIMIKIMFHSSLTAISIIYLFIEMIIYILLTRIFPLVLSVQQIFKKEISEILRENK